MSDSFDTYRTIDILSNEVLFKERKSKFYGYAFPIFDESEVKPIIVQLKKKHHTANHVCYAWQLGTDQVQYRTNDDGEPNNSAGMPIYGQIQSFKVTNVLVAVARIFGGTKLGVGGLISSYRTTAQMALEEAKIVEKIMVDNFTLIFEYKDMDKVMRIIKQHQLTVLSQKMQENCQIIVSVRKSIFKDVTSIFENAPRITLKK